MAIALSPNPILWAPRTTGGKTRASIAWHGLCELGEVLVSMAA